MGEPKADCGGGLEVQGVEVAFGPIHALRGLDLALAPGEQVAFVGPSGAGKTTLLQLLGARRRPSSGSVCVEGRRVSDLSGVELRRQRSRIAFVHQDLRLVPNVRVLQNVLAGRLGQWSLGRSVVHLLRPSRDLVAEVYGLLERVGIPEKLYQRTDSLSGGQQQRVAVARALFQKPTALLADEPVSSVDPARARETVKLLTEVCEERGLTLAMSLHDLELARTFFPRLVGLRHGRKVFDQAPDDLDAEAFRALYDLDRAPPGGS